MPVIRFVDVVFKVKRKLFQQHLHCWMFETRHEFNLYHFQTTSRTKFDLPYLLFCCRSHFISLVFHAVRPQRKFILKWYASQPHDVRSSKYSEMFLVIDGQIKGARSRYFR